MFRQVTTKIKKSLMKNICMSSYATQAEYYSILIKYLELDSFTAKSVVHKRIKLLRNITKHHLIENCLLCLNYNVEFNNLENLTRMLLMHHSTLENRIHLLREIGIGKLCNNSIHSFSYHIRQPAKQFKQAFQIPPKRNVMLTILENLDKVPDDTTIFENLNDTQPMCDHYTVLMKYFKTHIAPPEYSDLILYNDRTRNKYRSFSLTLEIIKFLKEEMGYSPAFVKKHLYLMNLTPANARHVLHALKDVNIDGLTINEFVWKWPRILCCNPDNIKELLLLFEEYNIPKGAILKIPTIFLVETGVFIERLTRIQNVPELKPWLSNLYIFNWITHPQLMAYRFEIFHKWNLHNYVNDYTLVTCIKLFQKDYSTTKILIKILKTMFRDDKLQKVNRLKLHPRFAATKIFELQSTVDYLKQDYTLDDIYKNIQILLYPRDVVARTLDFVRAEYGSQGDCNLTSSQCLAVCAYVLEKYSDSSEEPDVETEGLRGSFDKHEIDVDKLKRIVDDNAESYSRECASLISSNEESLSDSPIETDNENVHYSDDEFRKVNNKYVFEK